MWFTDQTCGSKAERESQSEHTRGNQSRIRQTAWGFVARSLRRSGNVFRRSGKARTGAPGQRYLGLARKPKSPSSVAIDAGEDRTKRSRRDTPDCSGAVFRIAFSGGFCWRRCAPDRRVKAATDGRASRRTETRTGNPRPGVGSPSNADSADRRTRRSWKNSAGQKVAGESG